MTIASDIHVVANSTMTAESYAKLEHGEKMKHVSEAVFNTFCDEVIKSKSKYLLITGDLTEYGDAESARAVADILKKVEKKDVKVFVINGNHDVRTSATSEKMTQAAFAEIFRDFGYDEAISRYDGTLSYVAELDETHRLIAIDDIAYIQDGGGEKENLDDGHRWWIYDQIDTCEALGKTPVVIAHIPFLQHFPKLYGIVTGEGNPQFNKLSGYLAQKAVRYSFVGHMHINNVSAKTYTDEENTNVYNEIMTGCLPMYGMTYRTMRWEKDATTIETIRMNEVNDKYLPEFTTKEEERELEDDPVSHARAYLYDYVQNVANKALSDGGMFDISVTGEDADHINRIIDIIRTDVLRKVVDTPFKKADETNGGTSTERILEDFGLQMFETKYKNVLEFAQDCVCGLIDGDENFDSASFRATIKNIAYEVVFFLREAEGKINAEAEAMGIGYTLRLDAEKLYLTGSLECYESGFMPLIIEIVQKLDISLLKNSIIQNALNSMKTDLTIIQNELVLGAINAMTDDLFVGINVYFGEKEIAFADLIEKGLIERYIADFVTDQAPGDGIIVIPNKK